MVKSFIESEFASKADYDRWAKSPRASESAAPSKANKDAEASSPAHPLSPELTEFSPARPLSPEFTAFFQPGGDEPFKWSPTEFTPSILEVECQGPTSRAEGGIADVGVALSALKRVVSSV